MRRVMFDGIKLGIAFILLITSGNAVAQDETMRILQEGVSEYRNDTLWTYGQQPTLVLVPFEPIMYKSQIDRSIGQNDGTTYQQIVNNWRIALDNMLFIETDAKFSVIRLNVKDEERQNDLTALYGASYHDYRPVPVEEDDKSKKKFKLGKKKKEDENADQPKGTYIENGQIRSNPDETKKFMARSFSDTAVFDYMYGKYGAVLYLFVNQFDIGPMEGLDYRAYESDEYQREIKVHYSVYAYNQEVYSGTASAFFSSRVNSQKDIILQSFPGIAQEIVAKLPQVITGEQSPEGGE